MSHNIAKEFKSVFFISAQLLNDKWALLQNIKEAQ
jgi:hypothetical protein